MKPRIIIHNSISLDGSYTGFTVDMERHYHILSGYRPDIILVGSVTARTGIEQFIDDFPEETEAEMKRPAKGVNSNKPRWVIIDTTGKMKGLMHVYRRSGFCSDVTVVVTGTTPRDYVDYLSQREYDTIKVRMSGPDGKADILEAVRKMTEMYEAKVIVTDSGPALDAALIGSGLVDEVSLLVSPELLSGQKQDGLFKMLEKNVILSLKSYKHAGSGYLHLVYSFSEE